MKVRIGVIGLGEVAQVVHLPVLETLRDRYELAAVCDISPTVLQAIGDRYGVGGRYERAQDLLDHAGLDAVLVLNNDEYHTECVVGALERDVHVLVEKPMCWTFREAEEIVAARERSDATVMVGYMRRFAPAFTQAVERVGDLGRISYARVHDIIGPNRSFIDQTAVVVRPADVPAALAEDRRERSRKLMHEAIGDASPELEQVYRQLVSLGSHDLSAMRELLGRPRSVVAARAWRGGTFIAALLDYGDHLVTYETGVDEQIRFDAHLEVYGDTGSLRVQYDTPYIRHLPTTLITEQTVGDAHGRHELRPHFKDPYTHELEEFHRVVTDGLAPKTSAEDYVEDLELFRDLIAALRAHPIPA